MDPEGRLLKDTITGLSTDTTFHYVQNESFELNFMEFFAVSNMSDPGILEWKRPLRNHPSETQANRKQGITAYRSAIDEKIQNRNSVLQALLIDQYDHNNVDFNNASYSSSELLLQLHITISLKLACQSSSIHSKKIRIDVKKKKSCGPPRYQHHSKYSVVIKALEMKLIDEAILQDVIVQGVSGRLLHIQVGPKMVFVGFSEMSFVDGTSISKSTKKKTIRHRTKFSGITLLMHCTDGSLEKLGAASQIEANSFCATLGGKVWRRIRVMVKSSYQG
ncbi:unnamed protein product [Caenorhabditis brenneri]